MHIGSIFVAGAVAVLSAQVSVGATVQTYSDLASWEAAVSTESTINFDQVIGSYTPPAMNGYATYSVLQVGQATFKTFWDSNQQSFYINNYNAWGTGAVLKTQPWLSGHDNTIHIDFSSPVTAFAMNLAVGGDSGSSVIRFGGDTLNASAGSTPALGFFGVTTGTAVSSIDVSYTNFYTNAILDNLRFATAGVSGGGSGGTGNDTPSDTPEAGSLVCCAAGLILVSRIARVGKSRSNETK